MKKLLTTFAMLALISACGGAEDGPEVSVQSEAAGDQCPDGGIHVAIDDEDHYICHGEDGDDGEPGTPGEHGESPTITTAEVDADDADNPCDTDAIEITIEHVDETTSVEYLCQPPSAPEFYGDFYDQMVDQMLVETTHQCECNFDSMGYTDVDECIEEEQMPYAEVQYTKTCIDSAYGDYDRTAPEGFFTAMECQSDAQADLIACWDLLDDEDSCSQDSLDAVNDCQNEIYNNDMTDCEQAFDEETEAFLTEFGEFIEMYCPEAF